MIPIFTFLIGLLFDGVLAGLRVLVASIWEGASTEATDSVDLRCFLERVGAMLKCYLAGCCDFAYFESFVRIREQ